MNFSGLILIKFLILNVEYMGVATLLKIYQECFNNGSIWIINYDNFGFFVILNLQLCEVKGNTYIYRNFE